MRQANVDEWFARATSGIYYASNTGDNYNIARVGDIVEKIRSDDEEDCLFQVISVTKSGRSVGIRAYSNNLIDEFHLKYNYQVCHLVLIKRSGNNTEQVSMFIL